jgi:hypothetical protein
MVTWLKIYQSVKAGKQLFLQIGAGYCCFYKGREENARIMCSSIKIITFYILLNEKLFFTIPYIKLEEFTWK